MNVYSINIKALCIELKDMSTVESKVKDWNDFQFIFRGDCAYKSNTYAFN